MIRVAPNYLSPNMSHPLNKGLVAWYLVSPQNFGGFFLRDIIGNNHGVLSNASPGVAWRGAYGRPGGQGALDLTGSTDDVVTVTQNPRINDLGPMAISAWIYKTNTDANEVIVSKNEISDNAGRWSLFLPAVDAVGFQKDFDGAADLEIRAFSIAAFTQNAWHHVFLAWDGTTDANTGYLLFDGVDEADTFQDGVGNPVSDASLDMLIGNGGFAGARAWTGFLDDIRIYNRFPTITEAKSVYRESFRGNPGTLNFIRSSFVDLAAAAVDDELIQSRQLLSLP